MATYCLQSIGRLMLLKLVFGDSPKSTHKLRRKIKDIFINMNNRNNNINNLKMLHSWLGIAKRVYAFILTKNKYTIQEKQTKHNMHVTKLAVRSSTNTVDSPFQSFILGEDILLLCRKDPGGSMSQVVGLPNNSYKPITNTAWVRAQLCKLQNYKITRLAAASVKVYQLLVRGRWFSPGTPASSNTKTGRHDIAEILLKVPLNTINQSINLMCRIYFQIIFQ